MQLPEYVRWDNINKTKPLDERDGEEIYIYDEQILKQIFSKKECDYNKRLTLIYHRATLLNKFYSTNILSQKAIFEIAEYINKKVEDHITEDDPIKIIEDNIHKIGTKLKELNMNYTPHSFLTKYCALLTYYQNGNCLYPIYDSLVREVIKEEKQKKINLDYLDINISFKSLKSLENYETFYNIVKDIKEYCKIDFRTLDTFMCDRGREISKLNSLDKLSLKPEIQNHNP